MSEDKVEGNKTKKRENLNDFPEPQLNAFIFGQWSIIPNYSLFFFVLPGTKWTACNVGVLKERLYQCTVGDSIKLFTPILGVN